MIELKDVLVALRKEKGLKQEEMAALVGVSRATWSDYERGKNEPNISAIIKIADYFRLGIDELLRGDVHLIEKTKKEENSKNVHLNVHPNVHLNRESEDKKDNLIDTLKKLVKSQEEVLEMLRERAKKQEERIRELEKELAELKSLRST